MRFPLATLNRLVNWRRASMISWLWLAGCASLPPLPMWPAPSGEPDLRQSDNAPHYPVDVSRIFGIAEGACEAQVELHAPRTIRTDAVVVFAHGFLHSIHQHQALAQHFAAWGVPTYLVGLCPSGWTRGGAPMLARLMRATADRSGKRQIIYGGFSAGGSAAYMASSHDPKSVGLLGLDPVGHGQPSTLRHAAFPALGLFGPSNLCNAEQSGRSLFNPAAGDVLREIAGTTHCHFESPTDWLCRIPCGEPGSPEQLRVLRGRIFGMATAYVRWRAGLDVRAPQAWWQPVDGFLRETSPMSNPPAGPAFTR